MDGTPDPWNLKLLLSLLAFVAGGIVFGGIGCAICDVAADWWAGKIPEDKSDGL